MTEIAKPVGGNKQQQVPQTIFNENIELNNTAASNENQPAIHQSNT